MGTEGVDAFVFNWKNEMNWLVPPISEVCRVVHKINEPTLGTVIVPYWPSAEFWPLLNKGGAWEPYIVDVKNFENGRRYIEQGSCIFSLVGSKNFSSALVALKIES